jgi:hypothetical protein
MATFDISAVKAHATEVLQVSTTIIQPPILRVAEGL